MEIYVVANATVFREGELAGKRVVVALLQFVNMRSTLEPATGHEGIDGVNVNAEQLASLDFNLVYSGIVEEMCAGELIEVREGVNAVEAGLSEEGQVVR
jgi:hypothetical protein